MKLSYEKHDLDDVHVVFRSREKDKAINRLMTLVENAQYKIIGTIEDTEYMIDVGDICYIESNERKVFFYTEDQLYLSRQRLHQLKSELKGKGFVQINKSTLMNMDKISRLQMLPNSKIEVLLTGGDRLQVSRTYIPVIKKMLKEGSL